MNGYYSFKEAAKKNLIIYSVLGFLVISPLFSLLFWFVGGEISPYLIGTFNILLLVFGASYVMAAVTYTIPNSHDKKYNNIWKRKKNIDLRIMNTMDQYWIDAKYGVFWCPIVDNNNEIIFFSTSREAKEFIKKERKLIQGEVIERI